MQIKVHNTTKLLGTDLVIEAGACVDAVPASNQPKWQERGLVFAKGILLHAGEYEVISHGLAQEEFLRYIEYMLIPDLVESGYTATAFDFHMACCYINGAQIVDQEVEQEAFNYQYNL